MSSRQHEELIKNVKDKIRIKSNRVNGYLNSDRIKSSLEEKNQNFNFFNDKIVNNEVDRLNTISCTSSYVNKVSMHKSNQ